MTRTTGCLCPLLAAAVMVWRHSTGAQWPARKHGDDGQQLTTHHLNWCRWWKLQHHQGINEMYLLPHKNKALIQAPLTAGSHCSDEHMLHQLHMCIAKAPRAHQQQYQPVTNVLRPVSYTAAESVSSSGYTSRSSMVWMHLWLRMSHSCIPQAA
jgi:hypothetical protein